MLMKFFPNFKYWSIFVTKSILIVIADSYILVLIYKYVYTTRLHSESLYRNNNDLSLLKCNIGTHLSAARNVLQLLPNEQSASNPNLGVFLEKIFFIIIINFADNGCRIST